MDLRKDFEILKRGIYLDSAATSQKPNQVLDAVVNYYRNNNANIYRGIYTLSEEATEIYEHTKKTIANFIGAKNWKDVVYVNNATEGLNLAAHILNPKRGDKIVSSIMEHHSNFLPWQNKVNNGVTLEVVKVNSEGLLDIEDLKTKIKGANILAISHASNVLGTINPIKEITKIAHEEGAKVVVDGAQSVPHLPVDVKNLDIDLFAFSGHKMLAPMGTGVLYGKPEIFDSAEPFLRGGGTIEEVKLGETPIWAEMPERMEGGTPNVGGAVGLEAAVKYLEKIGMRSVRKHELSLLKKFFSLYDESIMDYYGPHSLDKRTGLVSFNVKGVHAHDIADFLNSRRISVRSGKHCAHPLHNMLGLSATIRASFYIYNTENEIEALFDAIKEAKEAFS